MQQNCFNNGISIPFLNNSVYILDPFGLVEEILTEELKKMARSSILFAAFRDGIDSEK